MSLSLHAATIPSMLQILGAGRGWLVKARESGIEEQELTQARLTEDMLPFAYQIKSMAVHSEGAFEGVKAGVFSPDRSEPPATITQLDARLEAAIDYLQALNEDEVEALRGNAMRFEMGERRLSFAVDDFILSFSQPNFYFHATAAYGILRARGVELGKQDYLGAVRAQR